MSGDETEVSFFSGGERIFGALRRPAGFGRRPAAVLVHGFGSFRDELTGFVGIAQKLAEAGLVSLRLDMRGCGKSGARGQMHPVWDWVADLRNAISYLETLAGVEPNRIGVVGMSMGGGIACMTAALDVRLKTIVALAPVVDGEGWLRHLWLSARGEDGWLDFRSMLAEDRRRCALKGSSRIVNTLDAMAYKPEDRRAFLSMARAYPAFLRRIPLSAVDSAMLLRALPLAPLIAPRPLLIVHSRTDSSVPVAQAESLAAAAPWSRLLLIDDSPHCFWVGDQSERVQRETVDWLAARLQES